LKILRLIIVTGAGVLRIPEQQIAQILFLFKVKICITYSYPEDDQQ